LSADELAALAVAFARADDHMDELRHARYKVWNEGHQAFLQAQRALIQAAKVYARETK